MFNLLENMQTDITEKIESYFIKCNEVAAVYIFGSYAKGKSRVQSDIDLGVLLKHDFLCEEDHLYKLYLQELTRLIRKDIHLVIMNDAGEGILYQIFKYGKCIVNNNPAILTRFKMVQYSIIADFAYYKDMMQKSFIKSINESNL